MTATWPFLGSALGALVAAGILGGLVGAQRQAAHKPAGFRTHLLVALGSCAFMEASRLSGDDRIAAGIVTGIGFLGAGSIVREGLTSRGLTTAASIWSVAAVGMTLGFGTPAAYGVAVATAVLTFGALCLSDSVLNAFFQPRIEAGVTVAFDPERLSLEAVVALFVKLSLDVRGTELLNVHRDGQRDLAEWSLVLTAKPSRKVQQGILDLRSVAGIQSIELHEMAPA